MKKVKQVSVRWEVENYPGRSFHFLPDMSILELVCCYLRQSGIKLAEQLILKE
jgi:hypothetical protein